MWMLQFVSDLFPEFVFIVDNPGRKWLFLNDGPGPIVGLFHVKENPVTPIVNCVNRKYVLFKLSHFPKIEFSQPAASFNQASKMNHFCKMYLHRLSLRVCLQQFLC